MWIIASYWTVGIYIGLDYATTREDVISVGASDDANFSFHKQTHISQVCHTDGRGHKVRVMLTFFDRCYFTFFLTIHSNNEMRE